jgi:3-oxoacid CoA-transferase subunit A/glutaconate CoA-transferase subunit A
MPYLYYFDEAHIQMWLQLSKTEDGTRQYLEKYVYGVEDFSAYLEIIGGLDKLTRLQSIETSLMNNQA